jgi:hypothetical protein
MAFVGIVAFVGFAIDTGIIYLNRIWLGQAVDAASLAAGYDLPNIKGACARAVEYLKANDYIASNDFEYDIVFPNVADAPGGDPGAFVVNSIAHGIDDPDDCSLLSVPAEHQEVHYEVRVVGRQQIPLIFMSILGFGEIESGLDGLAERTRRFDISLVLDNSGSMVYDTCGYHRDLLDENGAPYTDVEGYSVYAANNLYPVCNDIIGDDFESYLDTNELENAWNTSGSILLFPSGGHDNSNWVEMRASSSDTSGQASLVMRNIRFDITGKVDIALFFDAKDISMESDDSLEVHWRVWDGSGVAPSWVPLSRIDGNYLTSSWKEIGIVLPNGAADTPDLQIRFRTRNAELTEGVGIDHVMLKSCKPVREQLLPVREYVSGGSNGCPTGLLPADMDAHIYAPHTMVPMFPVDVYSEPRTLFLEQPMYDVLRSTETFIDMIDDRRFDTNPPRAREDEFSLVTFSTEGRLLYDLTNDYEEIKRTLFTGIEGDSHTNLGDGMRLGLLTLEEGGRSTTIHFMVLITDGRPNRYGDGGTGRSSNFPNWDPATLDYIDEQIEFANNQNVAVFTIGLGSPMLFHPGLPAFDVPDANGMDILQHIASETGGEAYHAPTTQELHQIFEWIAEAIFVRLTQ